MSNSESDTNFPTFRNLQELNGNWNVAFRPVYDTAREMTFRELDDWTQNDDPYIRYFSGTATYKMSFEYRAGAEKNVWLDLGTIHALADVTLNGQSFRTLWRPPYRVDISEALKEGYNTIEVTVTNCWLNRLIGDLQFGARKYTWVPYVDWNAETPLLPSGLIGPVTLLTRE
ncbi:glycosylhydrolase-like jelly roll fold domain-containing protein [Alistipes senegalensis]|uniref:glycosylhydrolase-like jelly roll fold domain-containing protein n=1 Tax=Alistipes senegalensis TaxID=1288121 RepID=UPI003119B6EF